MCGEPWDSTDDFGVTREYTCEEVEGEEAVQDGTEGREVTRQSIEPCEYNI